MKISPHISFFFSRATVTALITVHDVLRPEDRGMERVPDSLLTTDRAIALASDNKELAIDIINTIRKRKLAPEWDVLFSEGLIYYNTYEEEKAEPCFEQALKLLEGDDAYRFERMDVLRKLIDNNEYLHRMDEMVRYAERLMADHPDFTIDAIMHDSGFKSTPTFYKVFRDAFGQTPSEYRKNALSGKS